MASPTTRAPEFVSFHADRPSGAVGAHPNANLLTHGYARMLDLLFRSVRLSHPGAVCTLLTDAATRLRGIRGPVRRVVHDIDHGTLMLSRSLAQADHVAKHRFDRPLVLLDSDILLRGSLQPLFEEDFDVALTWRPSESMPINGGLLVLHNRRPAASQAFFARFLSLYRDHHAGDRSAAWYGDQLALRDCVGLTHREMRRQSLVVRDGWRIRLLPCDRYNFSPDDRLAAIVDGLPDKLVLHFKGQRKRLMEPFWQTFLRPLATPWPFAAARARRALSRLEQAAAVEAGRATPTLLGAGRD